MSTILDQAVSLGVESTYGTSVAPTRSFEAQVDVATKKVEYLESKGMRAGIATVRSDRRTIIDMGGEGSLEADILNKGFGLLLRGMFSTSAVAQQGGTSDHHSFGYRYVLPDKHHAVRLDAGRCHYQQQRFRRQVVQPDCRPWHAR